MIYDVDDETKQLLKKRVLMHPKYLIKISIEVHPVDKLFKMNSALIDSLTI
jgi:hypothetical protein